MLIAPAHRMAGTQPSDTASTFYVYAGRWQHGRRDELGWQCVSVPTPNNGFIANSALLRPSDSLVSRSALKVIVKSLFSELETTKRPGMTLVFDTIRYTIESNPPRAPPDGLHARLPAVSRA